MDWKNIVGTVAPWIGTALTGPLGGLAVGAVADALGLSDKTEEAIKQAVVGASPEQMLALKNADNQFALQMRDLGYKQLKDMESIAANDRDSARKREMVVQDKTPRNLAYMVTAGFFGILVLLMFVDVPAGRENVLYIMLGSLGTAWASVMAYYYGSTKGSQYKTDLLAKSKDKN